MHQSVAGSWKHACMDLSQRDTPRSLPTSTKSLHNAQDKEHVGTKLAPRLASARSLPKGSGSVDGTLTVVHVASPLLRRLGKRPWLTVPTCSALWDRSKAISQPSLAKLTNIKAFGQERPPCSCVKNLSPGQPCQQWTQSEMLFSPKYHPS